MYKLEIKRFAIWARRTLIQQISQRAALFGLLPDQLIPADSQSNERLVIQGQVFGAEEARGYSAMCQRHQQFKALHNGQHKPAFNALIDEAAYTWFNRLTALRFMEVNSYLPRRALSSSDGGQDPDLLRDALQIAVHGELSGITSDLVDELRHTDEQALYRKLLMAQCNDLRTTLPFLFETISDELALLLPLSLLSSDSVLCRLVSDIPEADWREVEIIGWLYQYYISERKDEVIGAKTQVASADIPAATQLFTPNWIVQYMVQNSLGKLWLESHPESLLKSKMPYYLDTPPQEPEVQAKIDEAKNPNLQPQELTVMDPACGSGHILVYAFDLLTEIYREQGYRDRDIPAMIFDHNLHGLDIDGRAAQLSAFVLMMKARSLVRDLRGLAQQVLHVQSSKGIDFSDAAEHSQLTAEDLKPWRELADAFNDAETLGSLITPPPFEAEAMRAQLASWKQDSNGFVQSLASELENLLNQAVALQRQYSVVVANPPYMGNKNLNGTLKAFLQTEYPNYKADLFAASMIRFRDMCSKGGQLGFMTPFVWMFIKTYEDLRLNLLNESPITTLIQLEYSGFSEATVPICSFTLRNSNTFEKGEFIRLADFKGSDHQPVKSLEAIQNPDCGWRYQAASRDFEKIPGAPIAYWLSPKYLEVFKNFPRLEDSAIIKHGMSSGNNNKYTRFWFEVNFARIGIGVSSLEENLSTMKKWFPYNKGGEFRKWYGNNDLVINYKNGGHDLTYDCKQGLNTGFRHDGKSHYFKPGITWTFISSSAFGVRKTFPGFVFDVAGSSLFPGSEDMDWVTSFLCSDLTYKFLTALNPTMNFQVGNVADLPLRKPLQVASPNTIARKSIEISKNDWDAYETSWDFKTHPMELYEREKRQRTANSEQRTANSEQRTANSEQRTANSDASSSVVSSTLLTPCTTEPLPSLKSAFKAWQDTAEARFKELQRLEEENNRYWIEAYGLQDELTPEVPDEQITVRRADETRDLTSLLSYALGCIMGRYSLDEPGLIHAGQAFDPSRHIRFPADGDGIVPVHDTAWFEDDLVLQIMAWLKIVFGEADYSENLRYLVSVLGPKAKESPEETLRRYFLSQFMKDHHQIYKKRPIYWFFSSGKKRAFNAYVYLHRYSPDTLGLLRAEYLHPLQLKLETELHRLQGDTANAKRVKALQDQLAEIQAYDEKLKHKAEQRIHIDLDDGVAYNYTLFEGLVYEGADLKMADLKAKSQWKRDLLAGKS